LTIQSRSIKQDITSELTRPSLAGRRVRLHSPNGGINGKGGAERWSRGWIQTALEHIGSIVRHPKFSFIKKLDTLNYLLITIFLPITLLLYPTSLLSYVGFARSTFYPDWVMNLLGASIFFSSFLGIVLVLFKDYRAGEPIRWRDLTVILLLIFYMPILLFVSWVGWVDEFILSSKNEYVKTLRSGANSK